MEIISIQYDEIDQKNHKVEYIREMISSLQNQKNCSTVRLYVQKNLSDFFADFIMEIISLQYDEIDQKNHIISREICLHYKIANIV